MRTHHLAMSWFLVAALASGGCELLDPEGDGFDWNGGGHGPSEPDPAVGCEAVLCIEGTICIDGENGAECVPPEENPCNLADCQPDYVCTVKRGEAVCVPAEGVPCGDAVCGVGLECCNPSCGICTEPGGVCIQIACDDGPVAETCDTTLMLCDEGTHCDDISGRPECIPLPSCEGVTCEAGSVCELVEVQCVRAPCPPQPACVPRG